MVGKSEGMKWEKRKDGGGPGSNIIRTSGKVQPFPFWGWYCIASIAKRGHN